MRPDEQHGSNFYDLNGEKEREIDPNGNITTYEYDAEGYLTCVTDPLLNSTLYHYDDENHLTKVTDARGKITTYDYDESGRRVKSIDPLGQTTETHYDPAGNVTGITDALNNRILTIVYDILNNPETLTDSPGNTVTNCCLPPESVVLVEYGVAGAIGDGFQMAVDTDRNRLELGRFQFCFLFCPVEENRPPQWKTVSDLEIY